MKIVILKRVACLTDSWHSGGGAVIIAESEEDAKKLLLGSSADVKITNEEWAKREVFGCDSPSAKVYVFPDEGCC